jgi:hypothetical protein
VEVEVLSISQRSLWWGFARFPSPAWNRGQRRKAGRAVIKPPSPWVNYTRCRWRPAKAHSAASVPISDSTPIRADDAACAGC